MYVQRYIAARSCNLCCHEKATIRSIFIVGVYVPVNNIKVFSVAIEIQQLVSFALLPSYKIFCVAIINMKYYENVSVFLP